MKTEAKARTSILVTVNQRNSANGERPASGENSSPMVSMVSGAPSSISGRRRPNFVRRLSDQEPISGSAMASSTMLIATAAPTTEPGRPRTAV
nr:hypothetical protein [Phenylobacterium sp. J367]